MLLSSESLGSKKVVSTVTPQNTLPEEHPKNNLSQSATSENTHLPDDFQALKHYSVNLIQTHFI